MATRKNTPPTADAALKLVDGIELRLAKTAAIVAAFCLAAHDMEKMRDGDPGYVAITVRDLLFEAKDMLYRLQDMHSAATRPEVAQ